MSNMFRAEGIPAISPMPAQNAADFKKYGVITVGGYLGIFFAMFLPGINVILLIVWACGGTKKASLRNFARAALILLFFALVLGLIAWLMFGTFWTRLIENLLYYW